MNNWLRIVPALVFAFAMMGEATDASANVQGRTTGLGIAIGDPSGINLKHWLSNDRAFDVHLGFGYAWGNRIRLHADYLFHHDIALGSGFGLAFYYGFGGKVGVFDRGRGWGRWDGRDRRRGRYSALSIGARIPLGLALVPPEAPIDIFLEIAPGVRFVTSGYGAGGFVDGLLGVRFYF